MCVLQQVNWFATFCLVAVIIAVVSIYAGALNPQSRVKYVCVCVCMLAMRVFENLSGLLWFLKLSLCLCVCFSVCTINGTALQGPLSCNLEAIEMAELRFENDTNSTLGVSLFFFLPGGVARDWGCVQRLSLTLSLSPSSSHDVRVNSALLALPLSLTPSLTLPLSHSLSHTPSLTLPLSHSLSLGCLW